MVTVSKRGCDRGKKTGKNKNRVGWEDQRKKKKAEDRDSERKREREK